MAPRRRPNPQSKAAEIQARYDAAGQGRRAKGWNPGALGPNRALAGLQTIRNRALDAVRNDADAESGVQKWSTTLVGTGIIPRWEAEDLGDLWVEFVREADADGALDLYGLQALACRSLIAEGEVFARRRERVLGTRLPVPVQIQLVEATYCPLLDATTWPGLPAGHEIRQGIEFNRYGTRIAYWFHKEHPGDGRSTGVAPDALVRVLARNVAHVFEPKRPGQIRGVSSLAPVLMRLRSRADLEDAVLDRQKLANLFTMFVTRSLPPDWQNSVTLDPETGLPVFYGRDGSPSVGLEPGMSYGLLPGEDVKFANPPGASLDHSAYIRTDKLSTAAGVGMPYELLAGDIKDIGDRTLRVLINEYRRYAEQRQWHCLIPQFCQRAVDWWAEALVLSGRLPLRRLSEAKRPEHSPQGWAYIHPVQDVEGKIKAIDAGLTSRDREIVAQGNDPRKIDKERKAAKDRADEMGLAPPAEPAAAPASGANANSAVQGLLDLVRAQMKAQQDLFASLAALIGTNAQMSAAPAAPAAPLQAVIHNHMPAVQVTNNVEPTPVQVTNNVEPTPVQVTNNVEPTPVHVDVQPTPVQVTNNVEPTPVQVTNNVEPAAVQVDVNLPERRIEGTVERDSQGRITRTTQVETTVGGVKH